MSVRTTTFCAQADAVASNDYHTGAELNSNLCLDINLRHESQNHFGEGLFYLSRALVRAYPHPPPSLGMWLAGHRNGAR